MTCHPYPKVALSFGGDRQMGIEFVEEETGSPVSLITIYEMLEYYRTVCEDRDKQADHLYKQMANAWPVRPVPVLED